VKIPFALLGLIVCLPAFGDVEKGRAIYRSNCAFCHGLTGLGGRGPELVRNQKPAAEIKDVIKKGVPRTTMPSFGGFEEDELNNVVDFIRHLAGSAPPGEKIPGDPVKGRAVYAKFACASCHQIGNEGSAYGPELTRIGGARPAHYLRESITEPAADIPPQYEGVTVVMRDGKRVKGIRINEDTFSVQLRVPSQKFESFIKDEVKEVVYDKTSPMPAYKQIPSADLDNLVAYLATLRGSTNTGSEVKKVEGIR
jgi:cytochrome c oxidase cbb3-type subunit 3